LLFLSPDLGLNKDFKQMLSEHADFKALAVKEIHAASDGTRKVEIILLYFVYLGGYLMTFYISVFSLKITCISCLYFFNFVSGESFC